MGFRIDIPINEEKTAPAVAFDCPDCGVEMLVEAAEIRTSTPLHCPACVGERYVTYKEFLYIQDKCSLLLLECAILRLKGSRRRLD